MEEQDRSFENEGLTGTEESAPVPESEGATSLIDLNTAGVEELQRLPGIGQALAQRIVDFRVNVQPFEEPAEIVAVRGISETMYERMAGRLVVRSVETLVGEEPWPEAVPVLPLGDRLEATVPVAELGEAGEPEEERPAAPQPVEPKARRPRVDEEPPLVQVVPGPAGWGRILFIGLLSAVVGALLALAFLFVLNGTLDFQAATLRMVQGEVARFEGEVQSLRAELAQVEGRLESLDELAAGLETAQAAIDQLGGEAELTQSRLASMSDEVGTLRQEFTNLREDVDGMAGMVSGVERRVGETETQLSTLSRRMNAMNESVERFDLFMNGLRDMLNRLLGEKRPTPTPSPTVTVIPQATSTPSGQ